jgi:hypothetical protein
MPTPEPAFLTLLRWPDAMERDELARAIVKLAAMDLFQVRQRIASGAPCVLQRINDADAPRIVKELRAGGIPVIAPTAAKLAGVAMVVKAKRLAPAAGSPTPMFLCEPWRGEAFGFPASSIAMIVRARLVRSSSRSSVQQTAAIPDPLTGYPIPIYERVREGSSSLHDVMDIYLNDRRCVRCAGDKFNFDGLGDDRGFSDNENMDKLGVLLADAAPRAIIDLGFADFACPPILLRAYFTAQTGAQVRDDHPAFDFYSPWTVLVHAALARGER